MLGGWKLFGRFCVFFGSEKSGLLICDDDKCLRGNLVFHNMSLPTVLLEHTGDKD